MKKKVNVFMPCYNCECYLADAIESVLLQTYKEFDFIILDDGSTDNSALIIQEYAKRDDRIKFYQNETNKGIVYTRNRGLELCNCEYIALMDADDITTKERLEMEVDFLEKNPEIVAVGGLYQKIDEKGLILPVTLELVQEDTAIRAHMLFDNPMANGTMMFRKQYILDKGIRYRNTYQSAEDYRFWSEILADGKMHNLNKVFQYYRIHADSLERSAISLQKERRNRDIYETKKYLFEMLGYNLNNNDKEFFLKFLCNPSYELQGRKQRKQLKRVLCDIRMQRVSDDVIYNCEFGKMIEKYELYAESLTYRRIKKIKKRLCGC